MEFVSFAEAWGDLDACGVIPTDEVGESPPPPPGVLAELALTLHSAAGRIALAPSGVSIERAEQIECDLDRVAGAVDHLLHKMHLAPVAVLPRSRWRAVLDAVAFTLAEDRAWLEVESETTLILNTRDALFADPADLKTVHTLAAAVMAEGGNANAAIAIVPLSGQLLVEVIPSVGARIDVATEAIGDAVRELLEEDAHRPE